MHFTSGLSLALLGAAANLTCGFSLQPHTSKSFVSLPSQKVDVLNAYGSIDASAGICMNANNFYACNTITSMRGGSISLAASTTANGDDSTAFSSGGSSIGAKVASLWAAGGVVMILGKSIKRILPIALEPFTAGGTPLSPLQLGAYVAMCVWFAYVEGYKGFQLKFSPLVVARSQTLTSKSPIHHKLLGPFYAMGLFHATKKRKIISWSVSIGVGVIVAAVKRLPYPWRNIIDAGVIVGLTWGSISIAIEWIKALVLGIDTKMDPALPGSD